MSKSLCLPKPPPSIYPQLLPPWRGKKKAGDPFLRKEWYDIKAPSASAECPNTSLSGSHGRRDRVVWDSGDLPYLGSRDSAAQEPTHSFSDEDMTEGADLLNHLEPYCAWVPHSSADAGPWRLLLTEHPLYNCFSHLFPPLKVLWCFTTHVRYVHRAAVW